MDTKRLLVESLRHYWRINLAVWLGVVVGTAVLGGALLVGDSVRGSLRQMTLDRLGGIDHVLSGPRFFREQLAADILQRPEVAQRFDTVAPGILLRATVERRDEGSPDVAARAGQVNVFAIDDRLWKIVDSGGLKVPTDDEAVLSSRLAAELGAKTGQSLTLVVEMPSAVPRDSLLGQKDENSTSIPVIVKAVLPEASGLGRMGLQPDQQLPLNVFIPLSAAQDALELAGGEPEGDPPQPRFARCNTLFARAKDTIDGTTQRAVVAAGTLNEAIHEAWQPADLDLRLTPHPTRPYFIFDSRRMILDNLSAKVGRQIAAKQKLAVSPVFVYLANELWSGSKDHSSRYSVVAGVDPELFEADAAAPFGPFEFEGSRPTSLKDNEVVINDWLAADVQAKVGDTLHVTYHLVGSHGELPEEQRDFVIAGIAKLKGTVAADKGFTPEVHGITDVESFEDWNQPFPMKKVTKRDDEYWGLYRATPKVFMNLKATQTLWSSRYGDLSMLRLHPTTNTPLPEAAKKFQAELMQTLKPEDVGLAFQPVKFLGLMAASGTTDFAGLFIGFSLFLIVAALALISLLFRLGVERRASQLGLLLATGFSPGRVRGLLLLEALVIVVTGGLIGLFAAAGYAWLMIYGLKTWWYGAIGTKFLNLYVTPLSLLIGFAASAGIALVAVWWRLRDLSAIPVRSLLVGATELPVSKQARAGRGQVSTLVALVALVVALGLAGGVMAGIIPPREAFSGISWPTVCFMLAGIAALTAGISALAAWIDSDKAAAVRGHGVRGLIRLGVRNAGRQKARSVLTASLIATATFLIVAIAAGHKNPIEDKPDKTSGNGGFTLVGESSAPVLQNLNTKEGRQTLGLLDDDDSTRAMSLMRQTVAFRVNPGENASCLNIYKTSQPTILGVPHDMIKRGGFEFADTPGSTPWTLLEETRQDGAIPVFGDMNTLQYSLHQGVGSVLELRDEENRPAKVKVAGMFDGSVFQGVLLMSEANFLKLFPTRGYQYFLIDVDQGKTEAEAKANAHAVSTVLEGKLPGFDTELVADRLANFLSVQNTYLSTFQTLGGLGLLLGTIGLGTVMLRNVLERRSELALLRAVGFTPSGVAWLVLAENALLLVWGLVTGTGSALIAMSPHLASTGADFSWTGTALTLLVVFATGMLAASFSVREATKTPVLETLRAES